MTAPINWTIESSEGGLVTLSAEPIKGYLPDGLTVAVHCSRANGLDKWGQPVPATRSIYVQAHEMQPVRFGNTVTGVLDGSIHESEREVYDYDANRKTGQKYMEWQGYIGGKRQAQWPYGDLPKVARGIAYEIGKSLFETVEKLDDAFNAGELKSRLYQREELQRKLNDAQKAFDANEAGIASLEAVTA